MACALSSKAWAHLVADLATEPVGEGVADVVEVQGDLGVHADAHVVVHHLARHLQRTGNGA